MSRDLNHFIRISDLYAETRGVIIAALDMAADGTMTDSEALALIRRKHAEIDAKRQAAWDEYSEASS